MSLEQWEAEEFFRATNYMRPGKDDARHSHTRYEREAAWKGWDAGRQSLRSQRDQCAKRIRQILSYLESQSTDDRATRIMAIEIARAALAEGEGT